ncbi:MAG: hypothetical protein WBS22_05825 [Methylocystis sp.]
MNDPSANAQEPPSPATQEAPTDRIAALNVIFRTLYGANRDELLAELPLAGLSLIGTGEIWRIEFGQIVKCYRPIQAASKIKGLMHAVLGAHGAWGLLRRKNGRENARQNAAELKEALAEAIECASTELPVEITLPAKVVLAELHRLAARWSSGAAATADDFPSAIERCRPQLEEVIKATGDAVYAALLDGFHAFKNESTAERWRNCFVGVCGPGQGRRDNIEIAAAMAVMGTDAVGVRLLYLENAPTIPDGLRSLASIIVEKDLGQAVFRDPYRMWRDLTAETAVEHAGASFFPQLGPDRTKS